MKATPNRTPVLIDLPNRDPRFPDLYEVVGHPLHTCGYGRAIIFYQDISFKAMKKAFKTEESLKIPKGSAHVIEKRGELTFAYKQSCS